MKDLALILMALVMVWAITSWASAPPQVSTERTRANVLQARVDAQATEIVQLRPTPQPCTTGYPYFSRC